VEPRCACTRGGAPRSEVGLAALNSCRDFHLIVEPDRRTCIGCNYSAAQEQDISPSMLHHQVACVARGDLPCVCLSGPCGPRPQEQSAAVLCFRLLLWRRAAAAAPPSLISPGLLRDAVGAAPCAVPASGPTNPLSTSLLYVVLPLPRGYGLRLRPTATYRYRRNAVGNANTGKKIKNPVESAQPTYSRALLALAKALRRP
jgi:hypothetical protein